MWTNLAAEKTFVWGKTIDSSPKQQEGQFLQEIINFIVADVDHLAYTHLKYISV